MNYPGDINGHPSSIKYPRIIFTFIYFLFNMKFVHKVHTWKRTVIVVVTAGKWWLLLETCLMLDCNVTFVVCVCVCVFVSYNPYISLPLNEGKDHCMQNKKSARLFFGDRYIDAIRLPCKIRWHIQWRRQLQTLIFRPMGVIWTVLLFSAVKHQGTVAQTSRAEMTYCARLPLVLRQIFEFSECSLFWFGGVAVMTLDLWSEIVHT